ncbi:MAG: UDP-N-acetylglucosamine 4,6-dehydratase (inverting) [Anaerolineaceae bacterium]|nr:UDP-N-acetylglucosamine 4,6-dehydratase (inverting) [Anaerolineaceae bacterium]
MFNNQTILITGGTGSFGKKFTGMLLKNYNPKRIIIFSRDELKQHDMRMQFNNDPRLRFFIGNLRDRDRVYRAFSTDIDLVVHAAALKQVGACEYNPFEAVKTNVIGGQNVIDAAIDCGIPKVIALSTDKAVNPINLYGATKLCAEKLFIQGNSYAGSKDTRFSCVRYGNVVGSRGSVVHVFKRLRETGKITVTDERMTRFWITLEQAVNFVFTAAELMMGGETFIPRLPSMGIMDLVKVIAPDCEVEITGIRPGEKLHEILISEDEARHTVELKDLLVILPEYPWWDSRHQETSAYKDGRALAEGTCYASNTNDWWLELDELREMVGK